MENKGWDDNGANVKVEVSFSVDYITKSNCCDNRIELTKCAKCEKGLDGMLLTSSAEYQDPINHALKPNRYYLIYDTLTGQSDVEFLDTRVEDLWTVKNDWNYICYSTYKWYLDYSGRYRIYHYLTATLNALIVNCKCYCLPNTWAQLYVSDNGGAYTVSGLPVYMSVAMSNGINHTVQSGHTYKFKFYMYNNNCTYGYSNEVTVVVP